MIEPRARRAVQNLKTFHAIEDEDEDEDEESEATRKIEIATSS